MQLLDFLNTPLAAFVIVLGCLVVSAFFSASETALTAASKARIHALENQGNKQASTVMHLLQMRERLLGSVLIGNNIVNIGASAFTTSVLVGIFGSGGVVYATIIMSVLVIIFAEVLPKTLAISSPDRLALRLARPVAFFVAIFGPLSATVNYLSRICLKPFGVHIGANQAVLSAHEEILSTVDILHREGSVERSDRDMLGGLLVLRELVVSDVMVHRTKMHTIDIDLAAPEIVKAALASPYTRVPLWRGEPENIIGVLHAKDLLRALNAVGGDPSKLDIGNIALEAWFIPDMTPLQDQLQAFLRRKTHFALVVDEYGEVMGLITLEDIIEEIVGDIHDEHDVSIPGVRQAADGSVIVDGAVPIRDLNRALDWELPDEEATTIAGLVIHEAMTIPDVGQVFTFHGCRFEVLRKSRNRLTSLKITNVSPVARYGDTPT
ncbi:MAG: HlyC/CorC family transporter [Beijerinckiaceae bacterium]